MSNVEPVNNNETPEQASGDQSSIFNSPLAPANRDYRPVSPARMAATGAAIIACIACFAFVIFKDKFEDHSLRNDLESVKTMLRAPGLVDSSLGELEIIPPAMRSPEDIARVEIETAEKIALSKAALEAFSSGVDRLERKANDLSLKRKSIVDELKRIEVSDTGRRIATESDLVRQYSLIADTITEPSATSGNALSFVAAMKEFLVKSKLSAVADFRPSDTSVARLQELTSTVDKELEDVSNSSTLLSAIKTTVKDKVAAAVSLREQIEILQRQTELEYLAAEKKATAQAQKQALADFGSKVRESEKAKADSMYRIKIAKNESDTTANNSQADLIEEKRKQEEKEARERLAYQKLKNEFDLVRGDIDTYLLPFISPGLTHRGEHAGRGPVSYAVLKSKGALNDTAHGRSVLSGLANNLNGRPKGGFPQPIPASLLGHPPFAGQVQFIERAHELLRKFHPVLIKEGMLAK